MWTREGRQMRKGERRERKRRRETDAKDINERW